MTRTASASPGSPRSEAVPRPDVSRALGRTGSVTTWFHPGDDALAGVQDAVRQCDVVVVVDNTPGDAPGIEHRLPSEVVYVRSGSNRGLAAALNEGVRRLPPDVSTVLVLDQDSRMPQGMVASLARHLSVPGVALAAPAPWDDVERRLVEPRTVHGRRLAHVDVVITSGMLLRRDVLEAVGLFREDFFVDGVDQDLCLRLRRAGWTVVQDRRVLLRHRLGALRWHRVLGLKIRASHHETWRLESAACNSTTLIREHFRTSPRWALVSVGQLVYWLLTIVVFEPPRLRRAALFLRGVQRGARGATSTLSSDPTAAAG